LEKLAEGQAERLQKKLFDQAEEGDVPCMRIIFDRIWPARKGQCLQVNLPPMRTADDLRIGMAALLTVIAQGDLNPEEITALCSVFDRAIRVVELGEHEGRIEALEKKMETPK
jgi:hypothetical protein